MHNNARKTKYFRSGLEEFTKRLLEEKNIPHCYECQKFVLIESFRFENVVHVSKKRKESKVVRPLTYTPDFVGDN